MTNLKKIADDAWEYAEALEEDLGVRTKDKVGAYLAAEEAALEAGLTGRAANMHDAAESLHGGPLPSPIKGSRDAQARRRKRKKQRDAESFASSKASVRAFLLAIDRAPHHAFPLKSLTSREKIVAERLANKGLLRLVAARPRFHEPRYTLTSRGAHYLGIFERDVSRTPKSKRCTSPEGMEIQTLILEKPRFNAARARLWARRHGFRVVKTHETGSSVRIRQHAVSRYKAGSFRTIVLKPFVKAVVGCPT